MACLAHWEHRGLPNWNVGLAGFLLLIVDFLPRSFFFLVLLCFLLVTIVRESESG